MFLDMKIKLFHYVSKKSNEQVFALLRSNEEKSHYVFIKDFNILMYSEVKTKKNTSVCHVYKMLLLKKY